MPQSNGISGIPPIANSSISNTKEENMAQLVPHIAQYVAQQHNSHVDNDVEYMEYRPTAPNDNLNPYANMCVSDAEVNNA